MGYLATLSNQYHAFLQIFELIDDAKRALEYWCGKYLQDLRTSYKTFGYIHVPNIIAHVETWYINRSRSEKQNLKGSETLDCVKRIEIY